MNPTTFPPIPRDTALAARAVFGKSNFYLAIGNRVDQLFAGLNLEDLSESIHEPRGRLGRLYLITIFQFMETLPDHLAEEALRMRVDWKYALHLPMKYSHMEAVAFCEFRKRCLADRAAEKNFQKLLERLSEITQPAGRPLFSLQSREVITQVCSFSRMAIIWEALNQALEALATRRPDWLLGISRPHWYERFGHHHMHVDLSVDRQEQRAFAQAVGADGHYLLEAISSAHEQELANLVEVQALHRIWREQFELVDGKLSWREEACSGCSWLSNSSVSGSSKSLEGTGGD